MAKKKNNACRAPSAADTQAPTESPALHTATPAKLQLSRSIALISYAATLLLTFNWITWYSPPQNVPRALLLLVLVVPLVLPIRGFIHGRAMSTVAVAMVSMWLFAAGLDVAFYVQNWKLLGWALVACSVILFVACYFYLRYLPKPMKTSKPDHSADETS